MDHQQVNNDQYITNVFANREELYHSLIDDSLDGYYVSDAQGCLLFANNGLAKILGFNEASELIGYDFFEIIPSDKLNKLKSKLGHALKKKSAELPIRTRVFRKDGSLATIEIKPVFIFKKNILIGTRGIVLDITQRMDVEKKLQENEKRFSALFENANAAIFTMEGDIFTDCNQMTISMFGCERKKDIVNHYPWEFSPEFQPDGQDSNGKAKEKIQAALNGHPQLFYWRHCTKNKVPFDAEVSLNAVVVNKRVMIQAIVRDISHRKKAEEDLKHSEEKFRSLFENASIGIYQTTPEGVITMANPATLRMLGCKNLDELKKRDLEREGFGPSYSRQQFKSQIEQNGEIIGKEAIWKKTDGTDVYVRESARVICDDQGNSLYYEGTVEDVTARRNAERQLVESEKRFRQLNATKDKFFSIIAHDLKTPFNSIVGFSQLLLEDAEDNNTQEVLKYAQIILNSSERAMGLLTNLLDWARSQTNRMEFNPKLIDLSMLIQSVLQLFRDEFNRKSLHITTDIPDHINLMADMAMIETVLRNLISNAIKFTPSHGHIEVTVAIEGGEVVISVSDSGVGMSEESIERLFKIEESFSTSGTNHEQGTGLGLILCHEFVHKHNGRIWVKSAVGHGSVFSFGIPFKD